MPLIDPLQNLYSTCTCDPNTADVSGTPGQMLTDTHTGNVYVYNGDADTDAGELAWQLIASPQNNPPIPVAGNQVHLSSQIDLVAAENDYADNYVLDGRPIVLEAAVIALNGRAATVITAAAEVQFQRVTAGVPTNLGAPVELPIGSDAGTALSTVFAGLTVAQKTIPVGSAVRALVGGGNAALTPTIATVTYTARVA